MIPAPPSGSPNRFPSASSCCAGPIGFYQWNFSEADGTTARPAMELNDDHSLPLHSSSPSDRAAGADLNAVELRPGPDGGVFFNGTRLATPADPAMTLAGGSVV